MNTPNAEPQAPDNMELLKQQAAGCGAGCGCHCSGSSCKARWGIGVIVLIVAGVLVVRTMTRTSAESNNQPAATFAVPGATSDKTPEATPADTAASVPVAGAKDATQAAASNVGKLIGGFAELDTAAAGSDAVFVYLPGKNAEGAKAPTAAMEAAARTIAAKGSKCSLFTLQAGSPDYAMLGPQMLLPAVLAMSKGKGMNAVTGEITETKLVQGYVAASSAGGCGSGGCAPGAPGCN
jgi:hypothetical protein